MPRVKLMFLILLVATLSPFFVNGEDWDFKTEVVVDNLSRPWAVAQLHDGKLIITERAGQLRTWDGSSLSEPIKVPDWVYNAGQGGLLDVIERRIDNEYWLFITFATGTHKNNQLALAKAKLVGKQLTDFQVIFRALPEKSGGYHFAGRITFLPDDTLVFGVGDGYQYMAQAQQLDNHFGKVIRIKADGSVPKNNPYANDANPIKQVIYSYGHRNPQGMFFDSARQLLFSNEHGPKGGDEINLLQPAKNYGWPEITYGVDYSGDIISDLTHKKGMEQPVLQWTPSIAPSSILVYSGDMFPKLKGKVLVTALKFRQLRVIDVIDTEKGMTLGEQSIYLKDKEERLRDIEQSLDGAIYVISDSGKLIKLFK